MPEPRPSEQKLSLEAKFGTLTLGARLHAAKVECFGIAEFAA